MKLSFLFFFFFWAITSSFAQVEKDPDKTAANRFEAQYNAGDFEAVFNSFAAGMQDALPLPKTRAFLKGLTAGAGRMEKQEFTGYKGSAALYKTTFAKGIFTITLTTTEDARIAGLMVTPYTAAPNASAKQRNTTRMALPFKGEWTVFWGGDTEAQNYHVESKAQRGAFDIVMRNKQGSSHKGEGSRNEDYYCFGQPLLAPCAAEVVLVVDGIKDNVPGVLNPVYVPGNTVVLKTAAGEYLFFAHFKQYSTKVKPHQQVKAGEVLGLCGNSGNSSEPHLHFHLQDAEEITEATGIKCYFEKILVNGKAVEDYSPVQGDKVEAL